jgi:hypothetical protein
VIAVVVNGDGTFTFKLNGSTVYTTGVLALGSSVKPAASSNGSGLALTLDASGF